jgi:mannose-6-phosphate isomerase
MSDQQIPHFDPKHFNTNSYVKRVVKPWGYELHWVPEDAPYMGKVLHINAGARLSLQVHDQKQESWFLMS